MSFLCAALSCCTFLLSFECGKSVSAQTEKTAEIPPCPCHDGADPLGSGNGGELNTGNYCLEGDVEHSVVIYISGTVNLCLNGYKFKHTGNSEAFKVHAGATLNLFDCGNDEAHKHYYEKGSDGVYNFTQEETDSYLTGGVICGGTCAVSYVNPGANFNMYGGNLAGNKGFYYGAVFVTTFNMYGGKICGNSGYTAGGVYVNVGATFDMYGGEITDNSTTYWGSGGGVHSSGSFTVSGSAKIYGNTIPSPNYDKILVNNLCLQNKINVGELNEDAYIGTSVKNGSFNYLDGSFIGTNNSGKDVDYLLEHNFFDDTGEHVHSLGELIAEVPATCSSTGMQAHYTCTVSGCDAYFDSSKTKVSKQTLEIPTAEHSPEKVEGRPATCTEDGLTDGEKCSVCRTVIKEQQTIPRTGHNYEKSGEKPPTETEAGYTEYTCANCGDSYKDTIPETGHTHDYKAEVVLPDCTEQGYTVYTCAGCEDSYEDDYTDALGHNLTQTEVKATCEDGGYIRHSCTRCDYSYDDNEMPALGHDYSDGLSRWEWAENYFNAKAIFECTRGDNHSEEVSAEVDEERTTATCTQAGDVTFIAIVIFEGITYSDTREVTGTTVPHKYVLGEWVWNGAESASVTYTCSVCGDSGSATGEAKEERTEPTCETDGAVTYTVTVEYPYLQKATDVKIEPIPATGHEFTAEWIWSEDNKAIVTITCGKCEESEQPEVNIVYDEESKTYTATAEYGGMVFSDTKTVTQTSPDEPDNPDGTDGTDGANSGFPWILILIGGLLLLLFIIILIIILKRRPSEEEEEYDYDEEDDEDYDDDY